MADINDYTDLITSEHADKPKFMAMVAAALQPIVDLQNLMASFPQAYDVEEAVGVQLDVVGQWVGRSRALTVPIDNPYFTLDYLYPSSLPDNAALTRASATGTFFGVGGDLSTAVANTPRWTVDRLSLALQGLLCEPASENDVPAANLAGTVVGVIGSGGVFATDSNLQLDSCTMTINAVTTGAQFPGCNIIDFTISNGTLATHFPKVLFEGLGGVRPLVNGQEFVVSAWLQLLAGTTTINLGANYADASNAYVGEGNSVVTPIAVLQRLSGGATCGASTCTHYFPYINFTMLAGQSISLRIVLPQGEVSQPVPTSAIVTTGAAAARAADALVLTVPNDNYTAITITRFSGVTTTSAVVAGGTYTVPTSASPLQSVRLVSSSRVVNFNFLGDSLGLDQAVWFRVGDPTTHLVELPDDVYRILLLAVIGANQWDGTIEGAYDVFDIVFQDAPFEILINDTGPMAISISISGPIFNVVTKALITDGTLITKPAGVHIDGYNTATLPLFAFDANTNVYAGFDLGNWEQPL